MRRSLSVLTAIVTAGLFVTAEAQPVPEQVATFRDWIVYTAETPDDTICYTVTQPTAQEPGTLNHGDVFFMVSTWKSGAAKDQPSFMVGYPLRDRPEPLIRIGADKWDLFASGMEGYMEVDREEERLINAMRRGSEMRLSAMSDRGNATEYTFSLLGISNALDRVERACR